MIVVIDYGIGNLGSVVKAFKYLGVPVKLTASPDEIREADGIVLPGVGAFGHGVENLEKYNLKRVIRELIEEGKPFLGICLGMQLLFSGSEEAPGVRGLGIIKGIVQKFDPSNVGKIPHIGWNKVNIIKEDPLFYNLNTSPYLYFVHSFFARTSEGDNIIGETCYGKQRFVSVVRSNNAWEIQGHPEKSSRTGLKILQNFSEVVNRWK
ncbi:imidazole glycerol phosphate synthase subunit HisH [Halothermothrix orenii]|uniref:Imidazole glycerol phosphate synthase subunit HisH n=1 Tax=Halothermothrix orenii (strain H 168 / OCM 544 / DSM 9562) TaxID=373903 RepID=B8D114_HALOH|nr:imidazole glycerol phosphate synthase subunit HisH [Halothermothrix orenii]ACL68983.1 imidazole glycerol phosphate synthase, glutamine amidotransferase subunit [Halothermothrix orenii H 168]